MITAIPGEKRNTLVNLNLDNVTLGNVIEKPRKQGTSPFVKVNYKNQQLRFALREVPDYCKMPFDAGPYSGEGSGGGGGTGDNSSWTAVFNINKEERDALLALEKRFVQCAGPLKDQMYPAKAGSKKATTQDAFEDKYTLAPQGGRRGQGLPGLDQGLRRAQDSHR